MEVFISDIPDEGLHLEGEFPAAIFDLPPGDSIQPMGPILYSADLYGFEEVVVLTGWLRGTFQLQCGTCLEFFDFDADFPAWSSEVDLEPGQRTIDLKEIIREDFLLGLPPNPRCDDADDGHVCPKGHFVTLADEAEEEDPLEAGGPNVWGALDEFGVKPD
jgi:uncharacterized metal-binding protein YceD (DUF177 family)